MGIFIRILAVLCVAASFVGCATRATLTITSQPEGAYLTERGSGKSYGMAPATVRYDSKALEGFRRADGCYHVKGFDARWVSGVTAGTEIISLCGPATGQYTFNLARDPSLPGLDRDLEFAIKLQGVRAQQQQASAAADAAAAAAARNAAARSPVNCTSTKVGNTVQTNCW